MKNLFVSTILLASLASCVGCDPKGERVAALNDAAWSTSEWISIPDAPVVTDKNVKGPLHDRAADGTSWFLNTLENVKDVKSATWMTTALGVYDIYVNGQRVGADFLKPGFTDVVKTRRSFTYDVTDLLKCGRGEKNEFAAEVSAGWWRDKIVTEGHAKTFFGIKSAFRGVLRVVWADGSENYYGTGRDTWKGVVAGPVVHAAIFDGETYDAGRPTPLGGKVLLKPVEKNEEFKGEILPSEGAEVALRWDLAMEKGPYSLKKGETLIVDFGQNCAAVPAFRFRAKRGVTLTALPGEMLNDADKGQRGCDGPKGSVYRANLRGDYINRFRVDYTFGGEEWETYLPRFTFFGFRYLSITATGDVEFDKILSVPVTSIRQELETGRLETGDKDLNRFILNAYWGQLSNYLSVPTDCPQRDERLGWTADTQVFCEAGTFNADTRGFFHKWMRDMRDAQDGLGGFPSVAPLAQYGREKFNLGWADAGVIVPWTIWKQFNDTEIVRENWAAMEKFVRRLDETKYYWGVDTGLYTYADWLSFERFETCGNKFGSWKEWAKHPDAIAYRGFLAACYWLSDARKMIQMGEAIGKDVTFYRASEERALAHIRKTFFEADGLLLKPMRDLQTACVFALYHNLVAGDARAKTLELLVDSIRRHDGCLQTGFLGAAHIMDALTDSGRIDVAYDLLLNHKHPSWLYEVDQGATTVWERWNSYTKKDGFGPVGMNSFNHYAYGAVVAWIYRNAAGIAADPEDPGFKNIIMAPKPERRLGHVTAEYRSAAGLIKSAWRFEGDRWIWNFTIPEGSTARVTVPGRPATTYLAGDYEEEVDF